jgi:hypothetical protein
VAEHEVGFTEGLTAAERASLMKALGRLAANQGLVTRVHPDV